MLYLFDFREERKIKDHHNPFTDSSKIDSAHPFLVQWTNKTWSLHRFTETHDKSIDLWMCEWEEETKILFNKKHLRKGTALIPKRGSWRRGGRDEPPLDFSGWSVRFGEREGGRERKKLVPSILKQQTQGNRHIWTQKLNRITNKSPLKCSLHPQSAEKVWEEKSPRKQVD